MTRTTHEGRSRLRQLLVSRVPANSVAFTSSTLPSNAFRCGCATCAPLTDEAAAAIIAVLHRHDVSFVVIGGFAIQLHQVEGLARTSDIDVTPERSRPNLERLGDALTDLDARLRGDRRRSARMSPGGAPPRRGGSVPIATPDVYVEMLDRAKEGRFAYPAINVSSSQTLNAALRGFAEAESDGIVQVSTGGAEFLSGTSVKNMVLGAQALAEYAHHVAKAYDVQVALHTDHCPKDKLDGFVRPLIAISEQRTAAGTDPLFQSHMWDGSAVELEENLKIADELLERCAKAKIVMELEIGVVGGEEDGVANEINEKLYTTPDDALRTAEVLGTGDRGRYLLAATFGNVHGVYKPGNVKLRPSILKEIQDAVAHATKIERPFDLVFHGGSGSELTEIRETLEYGVVKMNVDTDTQYAFTRPIAGHMFANYDGVLKVDGEVGDKKAYDPRSYGKLAETSMAARVVQACANLRSAGTRLR